MAIGVTENEHSLYNNCFLYGHFSNQKDRLALVKERGFSCVDDCFGEFCEDCLSKEYCNRYDEYIEERRL